MRHQGSWPLALLLVFSPNALSAQNQEGLLEIRQHHGRVIVEGTISGNRRIKMMIDTGATCSVLSARVARELRLKKLLESASIYSNDRIIHCPVVTIPSIQLGPIERPLSCPAADLGVEGVDLVVGRDVLRTDTISIDFEAGHLQFGVRPPLAHSVEFDPGRKEILLPMQIGKAQIVVKLDSGADRLYFFPRRRNSLNLKGVQMGQRLVGHLAAVRRATAIVLDGISLGGEKLGATEALVIDWPDGKGPREWDGLLGLSTLKARLVRIDFRSGIFSWER